MTDPTTLSKVTIHFTGNDTGNPPGKLAEAELQFVGGLLDGLKLIGFSVWESRVRRNVTFPARQYSINGERRSFALVRPVNGVDASNALRDSILSAYLTWEAARVEATKRQEHDASCTGTFQPPALEGSRLWICEVCSFAIEVHP